MTAAPVQSHADDLTARDHLCRWRSRCPGILARWLYFITFRIKSPTLVGKDGFERISAAARRPSSKVLI